MNMIKAIATQHINHIKAKTKNLIIQCTIDPASPLNPNSPTIAKAILNAINPIIPWQHNYKVGFQIMIMVMLLNQT